MMRKLNLTVLLGGTFILAGISLLLIRISNSSYIPLQSFFYLLKKQSSVTSYLYYIVVNFPTEMQGVFFITVGLGIIMYKNWARILAVVLCTYYIIFFGVVFIMSYMLNTAPIKISISDVIIWLILQIYFYLVSIIYLTTPKIKSQFFH